MPKPSLTFQNINKGCFNKKDLRFLILRGLFFLLVLVLFLENTNAQNSKIDSLKKELTVLTIPDTTRVNLLNELAFSFFSRDLATSIDYLNQSDSIAEVIDYKKGKARSTYIRGITEAIQSNFDQALLHYNEALEWYKSMDFKPGIAHCYNAMGIANKNKGELRESIFYFKEAIKMEEELGGKNVSAPLINLGAVYQDLGDFEEAVLYLKKALAVAEAGENNQRIAYSLNNLGTVYEKQGNYTLALEHYRKSLYINEEIGDSLGIVNNLYNMGQIYQTQKNYERAMECYEKSLEINKRINRKIGISTLLNRIGTIYEDKGDNESALGYYIDALILNQEIGAYSEIPFNQINIGTAYLALDDYQTAIQYFSEARKNGLEMESKPAICDAHIGLAKTYAKLKNYPLAERNALLAQEISELAGFLENQKEAAKILTRIYEATGNYKAALENHQRFKLLNDSLFNKENIQKIAQLDYEYKYKQELDSASIRELELSKTVLTTSQDLIQSRQKYLWAIIGILMISLISGAVIFYQKFNAIKAKNQIIITEQKLLRSQMTPHFIFNSLSVLQGMILSEEEKKSVAYLSKFSKLLRIVLENSRDKIVPLAQELEALDHYMALQHLDADTSFDFKLIVSETIDINTFLIPPMLIQPFIENAIEHAFRPDQEICEIKVDLKLIDTQLKCTITDNGIGIDAILQKSSTQKKSLATAITRERLQLLGKELHVPGAITIEDRKKYHEQGTQVTLIIPYKLIES